MEVRYKGSQNMAFKPTVLLRTDADQTWIEYQTPNFFDQAPMLDMDKASGKFYQTA
jgi:hypothetical protein